jgi:hypothetical protein
LIEGAKAQAEALGREWHGQKRGDLQEEDGGVVPTALTENFVPVRVEGAEQGGAPLGDGGVDEVLLGVVG